MTAKRFRAEDYNMREVLERLGVTVPSGNNPKIQCLNPAHPDNNPSMIVYPHHTHCMSCSAHYSAVDAYIVANGLDLESTDDFKTAHAWLLGNQPPDGEKPKPKTTYASIPETMRGKKRTETHIYYDGEGVKEKVYVVRYGEGKKKIILPFVRMPDGRWISAAPSEKLIYNLHLAKKAHGIIIVEGEKAADRLNALLQSDERWKIWTAVTALGGVPSIPKAQWSLCGKNKLFILWPDKDKDHQGEKCMTIVAGVLRMCEANGIAKINLKDEWHEDGYDAADFVAAGGKLADLRKMIMEGVTRLPTKPDKTPKKPADKPSRRETTNPINPCEDNSAFMPLGYDNGRYYLYSVKTGEIKDYAPRDLQQSNLIDLAGDIDFWHERYGGTGEDFSITRKVLAKIQSDMTRACQKRKYEPDLVYGRGWHNIDNSKILHTGTHIIENGEEMPLVNAVRKYKLPFVTETEVDWGSPKTPQFQTIIGSKWCALCDAFLWEKPVFGNALAGWAVIAAITGILKFRPALWINGPAGIGKSKIIRETLQAILGDTYVYTTSITAAGAKRLAGRRSNPLAIGLDELDATTNQQHSNRLDILKLMREVSGGNSPSIQAGRGNSEEIVKFRPSVSFIYAGIAQYQLSEQDSSRIVNVRLGRGANEGPDEAIARLMNNFKDGNGLLTDFLDAPTCGRDFRNMILVHIDELTAAIDRTEQMTAEHGGAGRAKELAGSIFGAAAFAKLNGNVTQNNWQNFDKYAGEYLDAFFAQRKEDEKVAPSFTNICALILASKITITFTQSGGYNKNKDIPMRVSTVLAAALSGYDLKQAGDMQCDNETLRRTLVEFGIQLPRTKSGPGSGMRGPRTGPTEGNLWIEANSVDIRDAVKADFGSASYANLLRASGAEQVEGRKKAGHTDQYVHYLNIPVARFFPNYVKHDEKDEAPTPEYTGISGKVKTGSDDEPEF